MYKVPPDPVAPRRVSKLQATVFPIASDFFHQGQGVRFKVYALWAYFLGFTQKLLWGCESFFRFEVYSIQGGAPGSLQVDPGLRV